MECCSQHCNKPTARHDPYPNPLAHPPLPRWHRFGIDGLVIDPYNELDPARVNGVGEHEHVNQTMAVISFFPRYKLGGGGSGVWGLVGAWDIMWLYWQGKEERLQ
jgi:hypothetical protein